MPSDKPDIVSLLFAIGRRMRDGKDAQAGRARRRLGTYSASARAARKFSLLHFHTLRYIRDRGKPFMHEIAEHLCVTPPAATLLIEGLVKEGMARRSFDKKDRRAVRLILTNKGKAFLARSTKTRMKKLEGLFSVLDKKERAAFVAILKKIAAA